jgi:hypothetical protein
MLSHETFKFHIIKYRFNFLLDLMFCAASLWLKKLPRHFKHIPWTSFNHWSFVACIRCTSPLCNSSNIVCCLPTTWFKSTNKCYISILFLIASEINLKMKSQIFFPRSSVLWRTKLIPSVYYEQGVRIGKGLSMLFNPFET